MIPPRLQDWHVKSCSDLDGCLSGSGESGKMSGAHQLLQKWSRKTKKNIAMHACIFC